MASVASLLCSEHLKRKRNFEQMSSDPRRTSCQSNIAHTPNPTAQLNSNSSSHTNTPHIRRGLDLRRPIMSQPRRDIIDLTEDPMSPAPPRSFQPAPRASSGSTTANRPPRFDRNIINIDDEDDDVVNARAPSPDIEFLTSRPRSRSLSAPRRVSRRRPIAVRLPSRRNAMVPRPPLLNEPTDWSNSLQTLRFPGNLHASFDRVNEELVEWEGRFDPSTFPEVNLNFVQAGFNYNQPSRPQQQQQPRPPTYDPPPPVPNGFTRSAAEDDILVCPHCDDELGEGKDDIKKQVWVVKACGHVYCGECATNRALRSSSKTVKPWSKCVVEGCEKDVKNPKSIIQIYL